MKRTLIAFAVAMALAVGMSACSRETTDKAADAANSAGRDVKSAVKVAGEAVGDAADATGEAIDDAAKATGRAVENATK